jgi:hypothetical protein
VLVAGTFAVGGVLHRRLAPIPRGFQKQNEIGIQRSRRSKQSFSEKAQHS